VRLSTPAAVEDEVLRKAAQDLRFRPAAAAWRKLTPQWIQVLPDEVTPELARVVNRIARQPMSERLKHSKDLGETMVIAHAVVAAEQGVDVVVGQHADSAGTGGRYAAHLGAGRDA
jgi:hypothetical protein